MLRVIRGSARRGRARSGRGRARAKAGKGEARMVPMFDLLLLSVASLALGKAGELRSVIGETAF
jgi:hypothetical protein